MNKKITILLFTLLFFAIAWLVYKNSVSNKKMAYISSNKIFEEFAYKKELESDLKKIQMVKQGYLDSLKLKIQTLSIKEKNVVKDDIIKLDELKKMYLLKENQFNQESEYLFQEYNDKIWKQLNQFIEDFGKENKYDYLFGTSGQGNIMYASQNEDVTEPVLKYVNEKYLGKIKK